jgi:hypothetical protein
MTPEGRVLAACVKWLTSERAARSDVNWLKIVGGPRQESGHPDLIICRAGHLYAVELKSATGKVTPLQAHRLQQWSAAGATTAVIRSLEEFQKIFT